MKSIKLKVINDLDSENLGLIVDGLHVMQDAFMAAFEGRLIAHDLLEHVNGIDKIGSIDDELEALGATWFVRGQFNDLSKTYSMYNAIQHIAAEVTKLGTLYVLNKIPFRTSIPKTRSGDHEENFQDIIELGIKNLKKELNGRDYNINLLIEYKKTIIHYIRTGFRKARKKYNNPITVNNLFWNIANAIDEVIPDICSEGQEFILAYTKNTVDCYEEFEGDLY